MWGYPDIECQWRCGECFFAFLIATNYTVPRKTVIEQEILPEFALEAKKATKLFPKEVQDLPYIEKKGRCWIKIKSDLNIKRTSSR